MSESLSGMLSRSAMILVLLCRQHQEASLMHEDSITRFSYKNYILQ